MIDFHNTLIVVEGKTDIAYLSSFIDADFYSVNGSAVSESDVNFIKEYLKKGDVIVLTDPDFPGKKIRNYLNQQIEGLKNAYVRKELSIKRHKVGVAECDKNEIMNALQNIEVIRKTDTSNYSALTTKDLIELRLTGCEEATSNRKALSENFHLGFNNAKSLLKKLNMLKITRKEIEEFLNAK